MAKSDLPEKITIGDCDSIPGVLTAGKIDAGEFEVDESNIKRLEIPVYILQGGKKGPVGMVISGFDGRKQTSISSVFTFMNSINVEDLSGTIIFIPSVSPSAFYSSSSVNPYDGKEIDTLFPGFSEGFPSEKIAYAIYKEITEKCEFLVRVTNEEGGVSTMPYSKFFGVKDDIQNQSISMQKAFSFGTDIVILEENQEGKFETEILEKVSIPVVNLVFGGRHNLNATNGVDQSIDLLRNFLIEYKMLRGEAEIPPKQFVIKNFGSYFASISGLLSMKVSLGDQIQEGETICLITKVDTGEALEVKADRNGFLYQLNQNQRVNEGDKIFSILERFEDLEKSKDTLNVHHNEK